ncbi:hypothetical protein FB45DRAFT_1039464 [Roridomyces roridus]|uniref:Uncharacterized protein n=1 Tax=Roridomyces roridus TaxID=1738132 RepID=A0AAD7B2K2_9AGAR|nr:hypothetical protein FB45DRAFT_1039464 [Roridomyces roridus]
MAASQDDHDQNAVPEEPTEEPSASQQVTTAGDEGDESDEYEEPFEGEEEEEEEEEDAQPSKSGLTALLLANPNASVEEDDEEQEDDDEDDEYQEAEDEAPAPMSKKRSFEDVNEGDEDDAETNGETKKVKA